MGGLIETASGILDRRLLASTFVPVLALLAAFVGVVASGVGWVESARRWSGLNAEARVLLLLAVLLVALLSSQVLAGLRVSILRLYAGYWTGLPFGTALAQRLRNQHLTVQQALTEDDPRWLTYPAAPEHVMPTELGNILRGAEEHSADRYAIDAVTSWPRLYPTLPDVFRETFAGAAESLDLAVTISVLGVVFSVLGGGLAVPFLPWYGTLLCVSGGALIAWLGYRGAVRAAASYGLLFRTAFDVHRWCLLDAMGLARPVDIAAELAQWRALDQLWVRGAVDSTNVSHLGYPDQTPSSTQTSRPQPTPPAVSPPTLQPAAAQPATVTAATVPRRRARRLAATLTVSGFLLGLAAAIDAGRGPKPLHTTHALGAYHQIASGDLRGAGTTGMLHRYTLRPLSAFAAIGPHDLGPRLAPGILTDKAIIPIGSSGTSTPMVHPGDAVTLELLPVKAQPLVTIPDTLLLAQDSQGLVMAVPARRADEILFHLADGGRYIVTFGAQFSGRQQRLDRREVQGRLLALEF